MKMEMLLSLKQRVKPVLEVLEDEEGADDEDDLMMKKLRMTKSKKMIQMMTKINKTIIINKNDF
jgi:hypothetical protein